jgi:hypothetical protein
MLDIFSVAVVVIRATALWIIAAGSIPAIPGLLTAIKQGSDQGTFFSLPLDPQAGPFLIWWLSLNLLAALLLIFAKRLARFMTGGLENTSVQLDENNIDTLQRTAFSVLGAYLVVYAAPALVRIAAIGFLNTTRDASEALYQRAYLVDIIEGVIRLALGLWLLLGSRRIMMLMNKSRIKLRSSFSAE